MGSKNVLIIEDTLTLALIYEQCMQNSGYTTQVVETGAGALAAVERQTPDVILLDVNLPDIDGLDLLQQLQLLKVPAVIIVMTGQASVNVAVKAMQIGADDFLAKPIDPERLRATVAHALERRRLQKLVETYEGSQRTHFCGFIGGSPEMRAAYNIIENAAQSNVSVMVMGESGTGKELAAQAIHNLSMRCDNPMIAFNCAAIPHDLLESEIFGHVKGAFTGAMNNRDGAAKLAHNGTLFLDELTEMPLSLQSKLLRFIQTGSYTPVGSSTPQQSNIRFICATNRNPMQAIAQGFLREDLYYRLAVIPLMLPPLRERHDDIILLAEHFLLKAAEQEQKPFKGFLNDAKTMLKDYQWPGNVRELENVIRRTVVMNNAEMVTSEMLQFITEHNKATNKKTFSLSTTGELFNGPEDIFPMEVIEEMIIKAAIAACGGNLTDAARRLKISPATIHRRQNQWKGINH